MFKKITFFLTLFVSIIALDLCAQCIPVSVRPVTGNVTASTGAFTFNNVATGNVIQLTAATAGTFYDISMCTTNPAGSADGLNDSYLTILDANSAAANSLGTGDDGCTTNIPNGWGPSAMTFTAPSAGTFFIYLTEYDATGAFCQADGLNAAYDFVITVTGAPPTCDAGTLTSPLTQTVCAGQGATGIISSIGNSTPGDYSLGFAPGLTGTGGNTTGFTLTGVTTLPFTTDNDVNGVMSGNGFPILEGEWILTLYATDGAGVNCDSTVTTSVTFLAATDPACLAAGFDASVVAGDISEYTSVPLAHVTSYTPTCQVFNGGTGSLTGVTVAATITATSTNTVVYTSSLVQGGLAPGVTSTTLTAPTSFTPTATDLYLVEFIVSVNELDVTAANDTFLTAILVEDSLYARDFFLLTGDAAGLGGPWFLGATANGQLGNVFRAETNTELVSATATFGGGFAIGDQTQANLYSMTGSTPGALIASSPVLTVTQADTPVIFYDFIFPAGTNLTAGNDYLITVQQNVASAPNFGLYTALDLYTLNKSFLQIDGGAWQEIAASGIGEETFMIRANVYTPPTTVCAITDVTAGITGSCNPANNQYTQPVTVFYTSAPGSGMLNINGQMFAITASPQTETLTGLTSDGLAVNVTAAFTASAACTLTLSNLFTAPANCLAVCAITDVTAGITGSCNPANNQYTQPVTVFYTSAPGSGMLNINGQMFAITASPQTETLTGLTSDGLAVNVTAAFTANAACTLTSNNLFTAQANCLAVCTISDLTAGAPTPCVNTTNNYTVPVTVTYSTPPASGMLNINGQMFAITSSPQTETLVGLTANGSTVNVTASFTANAACTYTENALYIAPVGCLCPTIGVNVTTVNNSNCSTPNGSATANVSGGAAIVSYAWTPASFGASSTISLLPAGTYSVIVTDANGCTGSGTGSVSNTTVGAVQASLSSISNATCSNSNDGQITIGVTGGTTPITYTWSDIPGATSIFSRSNLAPGSYTVVVTDAGGCFVNLGPYTISAPAPLTAVLTGTNNVTCNGGINGTIDMTISGGTMPYTNTWTNSLSTSEDLAGLTLGTYQLSVVDAESCPVATGPQVTITEPSPIVINLVNSSDVSCNGGSNATVDVSVSGGTPGYSYNWGAGNSTTEDLSAASAGTYQLIVTDLASCTETGPQVTVTEPAALSINLVGSDDVSCNGGSDGAVDVTVTGGTPGYSYNWGAGNSTTEDLSVASAGTYQLVLTDLNLCSANGPSVILSEPTALSLTVSSTDESSSGANDGTATVTAAGGTAPYTSYLWDDASAQTAATASNLSAGTYNVVVTDSEGCTATISVTVDLGSGIRNIDLNRFQVYPNPATKQVVISFESSTTRDYEIAVYSTIGDRWIEDKVVNTQNYNRTFDVSNLAAGVYFVEIQSDGRTAIKKLTVTK
jgi:hypothetical protein